MDPLSILSKGRQINQSDLTNSFTQRKQNPDPTFRKAAVIECINQVAEWDYDKLRSYFGRVANFDLLAGPLFESEEDPEEELKTFKFFLRAPRNSLIIKFLNDGNFLDKEVANFDNLHIAYPFFSSHIMLPAKPGEIVWCLPDLQEIYWLSRVHGPLHVEDANYTHLDRRYLMDHPTNDTEIKNYFLKLNNGFPNGIPVEENNDFQSLPLQFDLLDQDPPNPFDLIDSASVEFNSVLKEPVPRFTPRPGDLVLQGSNNTAIVLTTNRGYGANDRPNSNILKTNAALNPNSEEDNLQSGCIDLVVGRGRFHKDTRQTANALLKSLVDSAPSPTTTAASVAKNTRERYETFKNLSLLESNETTWKSNGQINSNEGDPDLIADSARLHIAMSLDADVALGLIEQYPPIPSASDASNQGSAIESSGRNACIIARADEVRIVARRDEDNEINGSIKIVKEGIADDESGSGRAVIIMQPDGTIMIDGPKIVLGSGIQKSNGEGNQVSIGLGASEPMVLGAELKAKLEAFMDAVTDAFDYAAAHVHPTGTGPSGPPTGEQWSSKSSNIKSTKSELQNFLSKVGKTL
jgi:hypothetical protein